MMAPTASVRIDVARVHGGEPEDRDRLAHALGQVSPAALALPARATLVIRRLLAPRPLGRSGSCEAFVRRLEDALRQRALHARRSRAGGDDDDLLFDDQPILEAAIVTAWMQPASPSARRLLAAIPGAAEPLTRWRRQVLRVPALLVRSVALLAVETLAAAWLLRFTDEELRASERDVLQAYGVDLPTPAARQGAGKPTDEVPVDREAIALLRDLVPANQLHAAGDRPTLRRLLVVALTAARRPHLLSTQRFIQVLAAAESCRHGDPRPHLRPSALREPGPDTGPTRSRHHDAYGDKSPTAPQEPASWAPSDPGTVACDAEASAAVTIDTRFAGLLFLLNMFVELDLYGSLAAPTGTLHGLSPFELLLLLGHHWFSAEFDDDPLASHLRRLAGLGDGVPPGPHFEAPVWTMPERWLRPWAGQPTHRRGTAVWHPAGFLVADGGGRPTSPAWRRRRWLFAFARYAEARLAAAIGKVDRLGALALICGQPGTIMEEGDVLRARFALGQHPIEVRLAGLDRDLGWLPAAGRSIVFEFA